MPRARNQGDNKEPLYRYKSQRIGREIRSQYIGRNDSPYVQYHERLKRLHAAERKAVTTQLLLEKKLHAEYERLGESLTEAHNRWHVLSILCSLATHLQPHRSTMHCAESLDGLSQSFAYEGDSMSALEPLPNRNELYRLRSRVDAGEKAALAELHALLERCPQMVNDALDLVSIVKEKLIDAVTSTPSNRAYLETLFDNRIADIRQHLSNNPLSEAYATAACVAWFDTLVTNIAAQRQYLNQTDAQFWRKSYDRSVKRYERMNAALRDLQNEEPWYLAGRT